MTEKYSEDMENLVQAVEEDWVSGAQIKGRVDAVSSTRNPEYC